MIKYSITAIFLCISMLSEAQIFEVPLSSNPALLDYQAPQVNNQNPNKNAGDTIDIPFLDDFNYESLYPSPKYWLDEFAYVNKGYGIAPPTLGVATFDGLDENGEAYASSGSGVADFLTSNPIRLGGKTAADNVYLSFFYQAKGLGDKPESADSLVVEFKNNQDKWISVDNIRGIHDTILPNEIPTTFAQRSIAIDDAQFLFDGFQFRLKNYASLTGSVDHWHIDYVRVTENTVPNFNLNDVAFMLEVPTILENYTSMPWRHFKDNKTDETNLTYRVDLSNYFNATQNINPSQVIIEEAVTGTTILQGNILSFNEPPIALGNIPVGNHTVEKEYTTAQFGDIVSNLSLFDNENNLVVNSYFIVNPSNQDGTLEATLLNDTAKVQTVFEDYFSYDDGSAELAIVAGRLGDEVAVKFHTNVADTLRAFQMFIPRISGDVSAQRFNLKVWIGDLNTIPAFRLDFIKPVYVDSLNGWTTFSLDTLPVALPIGDFYIGWQQAIDPSSPNKAIPIGYDRNNTDKVVNNYMNIGNGWQALNSTTTSLKDGAIMIRAIVGDFTPFTTNTEAPEGKPIFAAIYPNPTNNYLFVQLDDNYNDYQYRIVNIAGQTLQQGQLNQELNVGELSSGIYFLNIRHQSENINLNYKFVKN